MVDNGQAVDAPLKGGRARFAYCAIALYLVGLHLRLTIYTSNGSTLVPMYLMLASGFLLFLAQAPKLARNIGQALLLILVVVAVQPFVAWAPLSDDVDNLLSGLQLFAGLIAALAVIYTASRLTAQGLRKLFFWFWALLMLIASLEAFGLRSQMQSIQTALYAGTSRGIYTADFRDVQLYGQTRPAALASEPSFLADSWAAMAVLVFLLDRDRGGWKSWVRLFVMLAIGYALAPSMKIFFYLFALLVWQFWPRSTRALVAMSAMLALVVVILYGFMTEAVAGALGRFDSAGTGSFFARVAVGPHIAIEALGNYPLLGYGIGNHEGLTPVMQSVWLSTGAFAEFPWYRDAGGQALMANGFWWQWVYLGLLGGIIFTYLVAKLLTQLGITHPMRVIVCTWIVWYTGFAFVDPISWWILAVFAIPEVARVLTAPSPANAEPSVHRDRVARRSG